MIKMRLILTADNQVGHIEVASAHFDAKVLDIIRDLMERVAKPAQREDRSLAVASSLTINKPTAHINPDLASAQAGPAGSDAGEVNRPPYTVTREEVERATTCAAPKDDDELSVNEYGDVIRTPRKRGA